jgi:hypothetical protein
MMTPLERRLRRVLRQWGWQLEECNGRYRVVEPRPVAIFGQDWSLTLADVEAWVEAHIQAELRRRD